MNQYDSALRFIPFRKHDLPLMLAKTGDFSTSESHSFLALSHLLDTYYHLSFKSDLDQIRLSFDRLNPDKDTLSIDEASKHHHGEFSALLENLLEQANYERVTDEDITQALNHDSLFKIRLEVNFDDFSETLLYTRGLNRKTETVSSFWGLVKKEVSFDSYDRVVIFLRVNDTVAKERQADFQLKPGNVILKLFKNVPKSDLEMLFPNTEVRMRLMDKLLIGVPAAISGGIVISTKLGSTLVLLTALVAFWLGMRADPVVVDKAAIIALLAGLGAFGSYLWKQFNAFKNRKLKFVQSLTKNLYFKNLDNNAGVFFRLIHDAADEEYKEALIAYWFLLNSHKALTADELDNKIEEWLKKEWNCSIDFEISDALKKLNQLGLLSQADQSYTALGLNDALTKLEKLNIEMIKHAS